MSNPVLHLLPSRSGLGPLAGKALLGLLLLGTLACGDAKVDQQAELLSRRDAEFADLSNQVGMETPAYLPVREASHPGHAPQDADGAPQAPESSAPK